MPYTGEYLDPKNLEPSEPKAKQSASDQPTIGKKIVAGTMAGVLTLASLPHGVDCVTRDEPGSLLCGSKAPKRHDLHIETASTASNTSTSVQIIALVSDTEIQSFGDVLDWLNRPRT